LRIIFLGTPEFAVPTLQALIDSKADQVVAVVCQPDRPAGRGNRLHEPPVKLLAVNHGIAVFQPSSLSKSPETVEKMAALDADVIVMVAFGQILKKAVLNLTKYGVINIHGSLLPAYRGAAPINWAIINGETKTGVTTMITESGVDTGPMLLKEELSIDPDMTSEDLSQAMSLIGAKALIKTLDVLRSSKLEPIPQDASQATLAPMLSKDTGHIRWSKPPQEIHNLVRGLLPWPAAYSVFGDQPLKVLKTRIIDKASLEDQPGIIHIDGDKVYVSCGPDGFELLELIEVQPANKARMNARSWANGARLKGGEALGRQP
jgi:methionyl-tRNA formyltransferase